MRKFIIAWIVLRCVRSLDLLQPCEVVEAVRRDGDPRWRGGWLLETREPGADGEEDLPSNTNDAHFNDFKLVRELGPPGAFAISAVHPKGIGIAAKETNCRSVLLPQTPENTLRSYLVSIRPKLQRVCDNLPFSRPGSSNCRSLAFCSGFEIWPGRCMSCRKHAPPGAIVYVPRRRSLRGVESCFT